MTKQKWVFIGALFMILSCDSKEESQVVKIDDYYNLLQLLDEQIEFLVKNNATLEKTLGAGSESETTQKTPSTDEWKEELKLFYNANINKLGLKDAYEIEELGRIGGGKKLINSAKSDAQSVRLIEYNFGHETLESLRILIEEENEVYVFKKEMQMMFALKKGKLVLDTYSIEGSQTMVMKSDLNFSLNAKVRVNP